MSKFENTADLTPEELELRAVRARRRFKALVRLAAANKRWLEDVEDEQLSRNVKKNVQLLTRKKGKKSLLTLQQKAILCKPAEYRTEQEKILLNRIIGGLKCFRKYPEHVKMQLAGVTYFVYYGPGRVIVRQNHEAHALYFIVTGEVTVSITTFDPVVKEEMTVNVGTMVAGSMFGEVSLLHDIPRTATITTATPCEFLCLKKADFDIVLKASVKEQWDEIQRAMSKFSYFDGWDEVAVRECCIYSKIKPFLRDQTILGDGTGIPSSIYFILKGQCKLIEHLLVEVYYDVAGRKKYKPFIEEVEEEITEEDNVTILDERKQSVTSVQMEPRTSIFPVELSDSGSGSIITVRPTVQLPRKSVRKLSGEGSVKDVGSGGRGTSENYEALLPIKRDLYFESVTELPFNVETHFMQVCIFSETACFGLGENMRRRRVVAMSDYVECLLIPRYWLFQRNKGNLWTRIQQYLDSRIPNTSMVFQEFIEQRKWMAYRKKMADHIFGKPPVTAYYNVPYSIRINEDIHLE